MLEVYGAIYNIQNGLFNWQEALTNFSDFADSVTISTTTDCKDDSVQILTDYIKDRPKIKLVVTDIKFSEYDFDGKLKNAALQKCSEDYCVLLDLDEFVPFSTRSLWDRACQIIKYRHIDGLLIPSINLCGSLETYKDIGYKFYLHKRAGIKRGVWNGAKLENGFIDIKKSDTCEALTESGELGAFQPFSNRITDIRVGGIPYVFHKWAVDFDKRIEQNKFWKPVWEARANKEVDDIILDKAELERIPVYYHNLSLV